MPIIYTTDFAFEAFGNEKISGGNWRCAASPSPRLGMCCSPLCRAATAFMRKSAPQ